MEEKGSVTTSSCCGSTKTILENSEQVKKIVRERYGRVAERRSSCCTTENSCYSSVDKARSASTRMGYTEEELEALPGGANLGLGCGNPIALASLKEGETVLDLGSGAGIDCFIAASKVGPTGNVIGVDMTPQMLEKARENAQKGGYENVEFRLGEIEHLPVADNSVDTVISNCVINLVPDKKKVFKDMFRVLKPGGRFMVSDIVLLKELPEAIRNSADAYVGCVSGAVTKDEYLESIDAAGFQGIDIIDERSFSMDWVINDPAVQALAEELNLPPTELEEAVNSAVSVKVSGTRPVNG